jgi:phosphate acetyltransferase
MDVLTRLKERAKANRKNICLAESGDARVLQAARILLAEKITDVTLIGKPDVVRKDAERLGVDVSEARVVDPATDSARAEYVSTYLEMRKSKGMTAELAEKTMTDPLYYAAMCVKKGRCDAMVGGSVASTADLIRAMLQIIRAKPGIQTVSSCFILATKVRELGVDGAFIFSDCALVPEPTPEMLVDIAAASAASCKALLEVEPVVAFLSYSTRGSGKGPLVDKVRTAAELFKKAHPEITSDGEIQGDAAIIASVAARKCKGSPAAGRCNVLIFPDLNVGNITYKLVERLGQAQAIGPFLQGLARPGSDLSRGCSPADIANTATVTAVQAAMAG